MCWRAYILSAIKSDGTLALKRRLDILLGYKKRIQITLKITAFDFNYELDVSNLANEYMVLTNMIPLSDQLRTLEKTNK